MGLTTISKDSCKNAAWVPESIIEHEAGRLGEGTREYVVPVPQVLLSLFHLILTVSLKADIFIQGKADLILLNELC